MKKPIPILLLILAGLLVATVAVPVLAGNHEQGRGPATHIIVFNEGVDSVVTARELENVHGVKTELIYRKALLGMSGIVPPGKVADVLAHPDVVYIERNQKVQAFPQDLPTGIDRADADLNSTANIDYIDGSGERVDVDIAIIDTGIDLDHPDLNVYKSTNCARGGPFGGDCKDGGNDGNGHGTHVAGTAAAIDDGAGVVGMAPGARLWAVRVLGNDGSGWMSWIIGGVDFVTANAEYIEVANMSLGCECSSSALDTAIANSVAAGVTYTVAAGNSANDASTFSPANHPDVITVSAIADSDGQGRGLGPYTSYGPDDTFASFSNFGSPVELAAPGVDILSTYTGGGTATMSGTSMASPHAAGAAALIKADNPGFTPAHVLAELLMYATPQNDPDGFTGDPDSLAEPLLNVASGPSAALLSISVTPTSESIEESQTRQFTATGSFDDGSTADFTSTATWASSNTAVATIAASGMATGVSVGTTDISAVQDGVTSNTASLDVTVPPPPPALLFISVAPTSASIEEGQTQQFTAMGNFDDGSTSNFTSTATWASSNTAVATIDAADATGLATGVSAGTTDITAVQDGVTSNTANLEVTAPPPPPALLSILVAPASASIEEGQTRQFTATGNFDDGSTADFTSTATWASSNTAVATIAASGMAKGVSVGTTDTTASQDGVTSNTATLDVTASTGATTASVASVTYDTEGGRNQDKHLLIAIVLVDDLGNPAGGAFVSIDLFRGGSFVATGAATTAANGTVTFTLKNARSGCYTETLAVTHVDLIWDGVTPDSLPGDPFCK